jgi:phytoene dehydrogenase-like protein
MARYARSSPGETCTKAGADPIGASYMADDFDLVVLGAGHNGLILQAYLCKAGLKVLSLDRAAVAGGGLTTLEDPRYPGFLHNTHAFFHRAITAMPWYADLELKRHGAVYLEPELNVLLLTKEGRTLEWWTDFERTAASFAQFSTRDAATLRRWYEEFAPIIAKIIRPEAASPPLPPEERRAILSRSAAGRRLLEVSALSPLEFVQSEFENPTVQAGLLFFNGLREVDLRVRGFGHHIAALLAQPSKAQMPLGGSASLARALENAVREAGGVIRTSATPRRIVVENGRPVGVETMTGEFIRARRGVVSSLNPQQTFLELLDEDHLPVEIRDRAKHYQYNLLAPLFALNLNLREAPHYAVAEKRPELDHGFMVVMGLDHIDQFFEVIRHHEAGTIPPTIMWGACPTRFDPSQAPPSRHTGFMWEKLPYRLNGDPLSWDNIRNEHGRAMLDLWCHHAPNLADAVIDSFTRSPLDVERSLPNMREGDLLIGAFTNGQIGYNRPFPGAGHYRAHLSGLYLCGSSSHPGGNITGLPGYNAAQTVLADLAIKTDWFPPPVKIQLASLSDGN